MKLLPHHQAHDSLALMRRWATLAKELRLTTTTLATSEGVAVLAYSTTAADAGQPAMYLSAGVHGDEAAPPWALLFWAEKNARALQKGSFLILPCLNPIGLARNTRVDHRGLDINRLFHDSNDPICGPWQCWITHRPMRAGLCLHEDYDAQGCYVYELSHLRAAISPAILQRCTRHIAIDPRRIIDGSKAKAGMIRRKKLPTHLPGMPEAIELHHRGCPLTLTFETPSEFSLDTRVATQMSFIDAAISAVCS